MIWVDLTIAAVAVVGVVVLLLLGLRLWRQVKAFGRMLGTASATLAEASARLESVQSGGSARTGGEGNRPAYTRNDSEVKGYE